MLDKHRILYFPSARLIHSIKNILNVFQHCNNYFIRIKHVKILFFLLQKMPDPATAVHAKMEQLVLTD